MILGFLCSFKFKLIFSISDYSFLFIIFIKNKNSKKTWNKLWTKLQGKKQISPQLFDIVTAKYLSLEMNSEKAGP